MKVSYNIKIFVPIYCWKLQIIIYFVLLYFYICHKIFQKVKAKKASRLTKSPCYRRRACSLSTSQLNIILLISSRVKGCRRHIMHCWWGVEEEGKGRQQERKEEEDLSHVEVKNQKWTTVTIHQVFASVAPAWTLWLLLLKITIWLL